MIEDLLQAFKLFFDNTLLDLLVVETNQYHAQFVKDKPDATWVDLGKEEMMAFLGLVLAMGLVHLPEISDYWSTESITNIPWFSGVMLRNRFQAILHFLHLSNNEATPPPDTPAYKLYKLGKLASMFNTSFKSCDYRQKELLVDEQMVGSKNRVSYNICPKSQKRLVLCEVTTGYCLSFQIYKGKSNTSQLNGLGYGVVFELMEGYLHCYHHVYFDNFYTSLKLIQDLEKSKTLSCGIVKIDCGEFPLDFQKSKMARVECKHLVQGNALAVKWMDKKEVHVMSFIHGISYENIKRRGEDKECRKAYLICQYNTLMSGVDKCDQYLSTYSINRRSGKWWKKVLFRLVELAIINAMVIYFDKHKDFVKSCHPHKKFRIILSHQLVQPYLNLASDGDITASSRGRPTNCDGVRVSGKHFAVSMHPTRKCCKRCGYKKNASSKACYRKTSNYCSKYEVFVCKGCFEVFDTRSNIR